MKKVLIISYHFPPDNEVGGTRPAKFAKYLPEFGWEPYVLTIKESCIKSKDYDRLKDIEKTKIFRVVVWPNFMEILLKFRNLIFFRSVNNNFRNNSRSTNNHLPSEVKKTKIIISFLDRHLSSIFELPDKMIGWLIPAVWRGYWLIKNEKIDVILTTSPPWTVSVAGLILSKCTNAKLITDYRDPWPFQANLKYETERTKFSYVIERWLERRIARNSKKVILTTEQYTGFLRSCYPEISIDRFCTITNGFDSSDYNFSYVFNNESDKFTISYMGKFYLGRTPKEFLEALSELCEENTIPSDKLKVNFIGNVRYAEGVSVEELIKMNNLNGCINISDKIPYRESLAQMEKSVVLLLFAPEQYYAVPAKAFEYIFANRYILCFAKDGATADLVKKTRSGIVVDPYDIKGIKDAIRKLYRHWNSGTRFNNSFDINVFERSELTHELSKLLDNIA